MVIELDLQEIKARLEEERQQLKSVLDKEALQAELANPDRTDLAKTYEAWERSTSLDEMVEEKLNRVLAALGRLDEGTFGSCLKCGGPIQPGRLSALPYAEFCITCQGRQEMKRPL